MADLRVPFTLAQEAFGVDGTLTNPGGDPVDVTVVWVAPLDAEAPGGADFKRVAPKRLMSISRAEVSEIQLNAVIDAPEEEGGADRRWQVASFDRVEYDNVTVLVRDITGLS